MNCQTIVLWGKNGSGKTTAAANLACALAAKNHVVGVISSNLYFGELQILLSCNIFEDKGLHKALSGQAAVNEQFVKSGVNSNVFILSLPNRFDSLDNTEVTAGQAERLINSAELYFDFLIVDGSAELQNPVTYIAMTTAKRIITLYRPSITACMWHNGVERLVGQLHIGDKITPVLNGSVHTCDIEGFVRQTGLVLRHELPFVKAAALFENTGSPVYYQSDRESRQYAKVMDAIADELCSLEV